MSGLSWWRQFDKDGREFRTASIKGTDHGLSITDTGLLPRRFLLELDWSAEKTPERFASLTAAKAFGQKVADHVTSRHKAALVAAGLEPPELFSC